MHRSPLAVALLLGLVTAASAAAQGTPAPAEVARRALGERLAELLAAADQASVYRVEPQIAADGPRLAGYPITAERRLGAPADRDLLKAALFDPATYAGPTANCFIPHHGARLRTPDGRVATLVVCFMCGQMKWVEGETVAAISGTGPLHDALEKLLNATGGDAAPVPAGDTASAQPDLAAAGTALGVDLAALIDGAEKATVFRIDPVQSESGDRVESYPIRETKELDRAGFEELRRVLLDPRTYGGDMAKCFIPHHALRVVKGDVTATLVLCFECNYMVVTDPMPASARSPSATRSRCWSRWRRPWASPPRPGRRRRRFARGWTG